MFNKTDLCSTYITGVNSKRHAVIQYYGKAVDAGARYSHKIS